MDAPSEVVREIVRATERANALFVTAHSSAYEDLFAHRADVTLSGPFGGAPLMGWDTIEPLMRRAAGLFDHGWTATIEVLQVVETPTVVCLVTVERDRVRLQPTGTESRWELRVTQIYERIGQDWRIVHRHADPLVERKGPDDLLAFAYPA